MTTGSFLPELAPELEGLSTWRVSGVELGGLWKYLDLPEP